MSNTDQEFLVQKIRTQSTEKQRYMNAIEIREESIMEGPENTWQNIGTLPGGDAMGGNEIFMMFMDLLDACICCN